MLAGMRRDLRSARWLGVLISVAAYLLAVLTAVLVVRAAGLGHPLADLALGTLVATVVVFLVSVAADNSSIYDPYWSVQPVAFAGYYLWTWWGDGGKGLDARQVIVVCLMFLYALRLTSNFYKDWPGLGKEDFRYRSFRERFGRAYWLVSFAGIHLLPTVMVYLGCLPLYAVFGPEANGLNWLDWAGLVVLLGAIAVAFVADEQLRAFRTLAANQGRIVACGLWAHSRHPNYLGEI
jgi:steroid 5-alpha reductase family enzyme